MKEQMAGHREFTEMERLMNALAPRLETNDDVHNMYHDFKGSQDAPASMAKMINALLDYKEAAEADMKHRESIRTTAISDLNKVIEETK